MSHPPPPLQTGPVPGHPFDDRRPRLATVIHRNIQALLEVRQQQHAEMSAQDRVADAITRFTGSMRFVYLHAVILIAWLTINLGLVPFIRPWDPYPFVMLAMAASVEAIFLSTFVLISQSRMSEAADRRADLDLHISLLAEHEVTRLIQMVDAISRRVGADRGPEGDLEELKQDVPPEAVLEEIDLLGDGADAAGGANVNHVARPNGPE